MNWNQHSELEGQHAFLGPSKYHWVNYDPDKLDSVYRKFLATQKGTDLHAYAAQAIRLGIKQMRSDKTLNRYINDAIGYGMLVEQPLFYSFNAFGTADAIRYKEKDRSLRIHDLKTGESLTSFRQLEVYAALFCLEYDMQPGDLNMELRIYQNDSFLVYIPEPEAILEIMEKIVQFDKQIEKIKMEELG